MQSCILQKYRIITRPLIVVLKIIPVYALVSLRLFCSPLPMSCYRLLTSPLSTNELCTSIFYSILSVSPIDEADFEVPVAEIYLLVQ